MPLVFLFEDNQSIYIQFNNPDLCQQKKNCFQANDLPVKRDDVIAFSYMADVARSKETRLIDSNERWSVYVGDALSAYTENALH